MKTMLHYSAASAAAQRSNHRLTLKKDDGLTAVTCLWHVLFSFCVRTQRKEAKEKFTLRVLSASTTSNAFNATAVAQ